MLWYRDLTVIERLLLENISYFYFYFLPVDYNEILTYDRSCRQAYEASVVSVLLCANKILMRWRALTIHYRLKKS